MKKGIVISLTIVVLTILFASCTVSNDNPATPGVPFDIVGTWTVIDLEGVPEGVSYSGTWNFRSDGTYDGSFYAAGYYDERGEGTYSLNGTTLSIDGIVAVTFFGPTIELSVNNNNNSFSFLDLDGDRWTYTREEDAIGDTGPAGGLIFYDKGSYSDGWRYLEAAPVATEWPKPWGLFGTNISGADGTAVGTGEQNTADIVVAIGTGTTYAAQLCDGLSEGGYTATGFFPRRMSSI